MLKTTFCLVLAAFCSFAAAVGSAPAEQDQAKDPQATGAEAKIPQEAIDRQNPVKPTSEGLAAARRIYSYDCAMCHGARGNGKGEMVETMKLTLPDWRDPASSTSKKTDGELFYITSEGWGKMPGEKDRANETLRWNLVNLVRSFATKPGEKPNGAR
jgi:mono/diheme cytochrome c family protein